MNMKKKNRLFTAFVSLLAVLCIFSVATAQQSAQEQQSKHILGAAGIEGGLIVHIGCGDVRLTAALHANDSYLVHGLDADADNVEKARKHTRSLGLYGKVSLDRLIGDCLPYTDNLVNLIVSEDLAKGNRRMDTLSSRCN